MQEEGTCWHTSLKEHPHRRARYGKKGATAGGKETRVGNNINIITLRKARRQRDTIDRHDRDHHRFEF